MTAARAYMPANDMTARARAYLAIAGVRHLLVGSFALIVPAWFKSTSFLPIIEAAPLWFWGAFSIGAALACMAAAILGRGSLLGLFLLFRSGVRSPGDVRGSLAGVRPDDGDCCADETVTVSTR